MWNDPDLWTPRNVDVAPQKHKQSLKQDANGKRKQLVERNMRAAEVKNKTNHISSAGTGTSGVEEKFKYCQQTKYQKSELRAWLENNTLIQPSRVYTFTLTFDICQVI